MCVGVGDGVEGVANVVCGMKVTQSLEETNARCVIGYSVRYRHYCCQTFCHVICLNAAISAEDVLSLAILLAHSCQIMCVTVICPSG